jgi:TolA-binding protein
MKRFFPLTVFFIVIAGLLASSIFSCRSREQALYEQATAALDDGLSGAAVEYLTTFLTRYPESPLIPEVLFRRGTIYHLYHSRYLDAILDFRELLDRFPEHPRALETRKKIAELLEKKVRDFSKAIVEYQKLITDYDEAADKDLFQYHIGVCFFELLDFERAKIEFYYLINRYPESDLVDDAFFQIANILQTQGALEDAQKAYGHYLARFPEGELALDARFNLAATLEEMGRLEEALEMYNQIYPAYENKEAITWRIEKVRNRLENRGR